MPGILHFQDHDEPFWLEAEPGLWSPIDRAHLADIINSARILARFPGQPDPRSSLLVAEPGGSDAAFLTCPASGDVFSLDHVVNMCRALNLIQRACICTCPPDGKRGKR
jgi:hypothetical protein